MKRSSRLQLLALESREVPAVLLPTGLAVGSGLYTAGGDVLAGAINGTPAYVNIANGTAGSVTVLPSLSVAANGAGGNPEGAVLDVIRNTVGETIFVGSSRSDTSNQGVAFGEGTTWTANSLLPVGYGYADNTGSSGLWSGTPNNTFVGSTTGSPIINIGGVWSILPTASGLGGSFALAISSNSNYVVGVDGGNSVAWKKNIAGTYEIVTLQAPTAGGPLGFMSGVVNNFAAGQYYDPTLESYVGAIWNLDTGAMVRDFKGYGAVDSEVQFQQIGNEFVAVFSGTEGQSPLVHLFNANRTFQLSALGLTGIGRVTDIWQRPDGALGLSYQSTDGKWYYESLAKNDLNRRWDGFAEDGPPVQLPNGFTATSGLFGSAGEIVGGVIASKPAYLSIANNTASAVTILPSLSVVTNGASGNPAGFVQDLILNAGSETIFVGSSQSNTSNYGGSGEASTWIFGQNQPLGYGYTSNEDGSVFLNGNTTGNYAGSSSGTPVVHQASISSYLILPSSSSASYALAISADSKYIVGVDADRAVAWKRISSSTYELVALQAPTAGGPLGSMSGVVNNFAAGQYYDPILESYVGAIWNLDTGAMVRDFKSYGAIDVDVNFQQIGDEFVAIFSSTEGKSPLVHLFNANRTFPLNSLPSLGAVGSIPGENTISRVSDIWERPDGSLGLSYLGIDGAWYYDCLPTNDRNEPWTTAPLPPANQPPANLQLSGSSIAENLPAGTIIGTLTATDPEAATLTYALVSTGVPFEVVNGILRSTAALDFETTPTYTLTLRATDPLGESVTRDFTITVVDVLDDPPILPGPTGGPSRWLTVPGTGNAISVIDAATGLEAYSRTPFGAPGTAIAVDFNGDGTPDLLAGAGAGAPPHIKLIDGATGAELFSFYAFDRTFLGGVTVASADIDGDGTLDFIVGAGPGAGPHVKVFDGRTGAERMSFFAFDAGFAGGVNVTGGDFDGDGFGDVIVGAGPGAGPHVKVFSGRTGLELASFFAYDRDFHGGVFVAAADFDVDGRADIVTGAGPGAPAHVRVFVGQSLFGEAVLGDPNSLAGGEVDARDADGDGIVDLVTTIRGVPRSEIFAIDSADVRNGSMTARRLR